MTFPMMEESGRKDSGMMFPGTKSFAVVRGLTLSLCFFSSLAVQAGERRIQFPSNFKWCVATAAYQVEGDNFASDLYRWETEAPDRVITRELVPGAAQVTEPPYYLGGKMPSCPVLPAADALAIDPTGAHTRKFPHADGTVSVCEFSGKSVDHWNRVAGDIQLMKNMGLQQYRFSVEWSRIEPQKGVFDEVALKHYVDEVQLLRDNGIEPLVTLFHFSMPQWLRDQGGWESPEAPQLFARFTGLVYQALGQNVTTWFTLNEPMVHLSSGYLGGALPPGKNTLDPRTLEAPLFGMLQAHAAAYHVLHDLAAANGQNVRVGVAHHLRIFDPQSNWLGPASLDSIVAHNVDLLWNWMVVDAIETGYVRVSISVFTPNGFAFVKKEVPGLKGSQDFFGLNYYTRDMIHIDPIKFQFQQLVNGDAQAAGRVNDMGWEIYPEGLYRILKAIDVRVSEQGHRHLPIFISENGIPDASDTQRQGFLEDHLAAVSDAMQGHVYNSDEMSGDAPVEVEGYCHWTLIDNFEWNSGYYPHFGFYSVNLETQERSLRASGQWFSKVIQDSGFEYAR